jgi:hypothetical protein
METRESKGREDRVDNDEGKESARIGTGFQDQKEERWNRRAERLQGDKWTHRVQG